MQLHFEDVVKRLRSSHHWCKSQFITLPPHTGMYKLLYLPPFLRIIISIPTELLTSPVQCGNQRH